MEFLPAALLDPQQTGYAPMLRPARALGGVLESKQLGEPAFRFGVLQQPAVDLEAAALAREEALAQAIRLTAAGEVDLHAGCGPGIAPWQ